MPRLISSTQMFCSVCGCYYSSKFRRAGDVCGDQSGGVNLDKPCIGVVQLEEYGHRVEERKRVSMQKKVPA